MGTISEFLTQAHHHCDNLFAAAENAVVEGDWEAAARHFTDFEKETERHFHMEESLMFPAFEKAAGMSMGPTEVMRMEHSQMREVFAEMAEGVRLRNKAAYLGASETMLMLMQQHNLKEEQMLYRMADQLLAGGQAESVLEAMRALQGE
ncbi:MAG: hemerythrin domain-containing protein [Burkholderiales bacterium]